MPEDQLQKEREIYTAQAADSGKPPEIVEKMIEGRIRKYLENSLTEQAFVKDPDVTVGKLVKAAGASIAGFTRFEVGEGIEVEKVDFAAELPRSSVINNARHTEKTSKSLVNGDWGLGEQNRKRRVQMIGLFCPSCWMLRSFFRVLTVTAQ